MEFSYVLHPPVQYDDQYAHINIKFMQDHPAIKNVHIVIPATYVVSIFPHPPTLTVTTVGDNYVISGSSAKGELLEVEMLLNKDYLKVTSGVPVSTNNVKGQTESSNQAYSLQYTVFGVLNMLAKALVLVIPFLFLGIWYALGREKKFTVPEYLSVVPNEKLKPWEVNLLFKGRANDFDQDGLYGTLVDLHLRKKIEMTEKEGGKGQVIRVLDENVDDSYESKVIQFLKNVSENGVVDTEEVQRLSKEAQRSMQGTEAARKMKKYSLEYYLVLNTVDKSLTGEYTEDGRKYLVPLLVLAIVGFVAALLTGVLLAGNSDWSLLLIGAMILFGVAFVQLLIGVAYPSTLFGFWKGDHYKEKLEWDAFAHFLSDLAMIKKYKPAGRLHVGRMAGLRHCARRRQERRESDGTA